MLDGFFGGSRWATNKTKKQSLERRISDSVVNMVIERDQSYLSTAREGKTSIIVNNRSGGIQQFSHDGRNYISFPSEMEDEFEGLDEYDAEDKMDSLIKLVTTRNDFEYPEDRIGEKIFDTNALYKSKTGKETGFVIDVDEHGKATNNPFEFRAVKSNEEKENEEDAKEGEDGSSGSKELTSKGIQDNSSSSRTANVEVGGDERNREYSFQDTDLNIGEAMPEECKDNKFFGSRYDDDESTEVSFHRQEHLKKLAKQIIKSFKGRVSKQRTMIPSKRLVSKSLTVDITEKIYENKRGDNGKHLNINLIIDMSGSMEGTPVSNAVEMIYIFNEIASAGYLTGSVLWSASSERVISTFPMPREFVLEMRKTRGSEGLGRNLTYFKDNLKKADTNICMTDGQLADDPILKSMYDKEGIQIIGVYVNKDAEDLTEYTGSLDRWFTHSLVRHTTEELCEKLIQFSLRKKK